MPAIITNESGVGTGNVAVEAGRRYSFAWAKDDINGPTTGTLTPKLNWQVNQSAVQNLHRPDQSAITYDLAAVASGAVEFVPAANSLLEVNISGGGASKVVYFHVVPVIR